MRVYELMGLLAKCHSGAEVVLDTEDGVELPVYEVDDCEDMVFLNSSGYVYTKDQKGEKRSKKK